MVDNSWKVNVQESTCQQRREGMQRSRRIFRNEHIPPSLHLSPSTRTNTRIRQLKPFFPAVINAAFGPFVFSFRLSFAFCLVIATIGIIVSTSYLFCCLVAVSSITLLYYSSPASTLPFALSFRPPQCRFITRDCINSDHTGKC